MEGGVRMLVDEGASIVDFVVDDDEEVLETGWLET